MKFKATGIAILALLGLASLYFGTVTGFNIYYVVAAGSFIVLGAGLFIGLRGSFSWNL